LFDTNEDGRDESRSRIEEDDEADNEEEEKEDKEDEEEECFASVVEDWEVEDEGKDEEEETEEDEGFPPKGREEVCVLAV
jgi:hypothetical protein